MMSVWLQADRCQMSLEVQQTQDGLEGNKWCPKDCVDQETIGARELSGTCHLQMRQ